MRLADLLTLAPRFTRSVNLERDAMIPEATDGYILTGTARSVLERLAVSLRANAGQHAFTITGPYGSGKSSFALYLSHLVGPPEAPQARAARALLKDQAPDLHAALLDRRTKDAVVREGYFPVLISGSPEALVGAIAQAAASQVRPLLGPGRVPDCVKALEALAAQAANGDTVPGTEVVAALVEIALHLQVTGRGQGVFLIIDELGKFLEFAAREPQRGDVFILQELAEATAGGTGLCLVTILHQAFERYAADLASTAREEWAKIQGRFEDIAFQESPEQLMDLLAQAIGHVPHPLTKRLEAQARALAETAAGLDLAPRGETRAQFVQTMIRCAPLHPLTVLVLVQLCRKFGQHQRSLFSFLVSNEPHGFSQFLDAEITPNTVPFYGLDALYDYVAEALGNGLSVGESATRWAEVQAALDVAAGLPASERRLIKTVGLLSAVGIHGTLKPTAGVLAFAAPDEREGKEARESLLKRSIIVHRKHNQSFGLWQGSDIDLDARVREARRRVAPGESLARKLGALWTAQPLVAKRHSFLTGTLRYFVVRFADVETFSDALVPDRDADGLLVYCLPGSMEEHEALVTAAAAIARDRLDVLLAIPHDVQSLHDAVMDLELLRWVEANTPELRGDSVARRELHGRIGAAESRVGVEMQRLFSPAGLSGTAHWYHRGLRQRVGSVRSLAHLVSAICDAVYEHTPQLRNELVNRRCLSSAAAKARRNLLEAMVTHGEQEFLGIVGAPPELSMYASVLRATGIHRPGSAGFEFGPPEHDAGLIAVWGAIEAFFGGCELQRGSVADLFRVLQAPPFGLKQGVIPVLFCAAALAHDLDVALYESGAFVPELSIEVFERLVRSPEKFELRRYQITGVRREVFRQFAELFGPARESGGPDVVAVVRPFYRFLNKLPSFARQTKNVSTTAVRVREALLAAREPDVLLFEDLPSACGFGPFLASGSEGQADQRLFFRTLQGALQELQRAYDDLLLDLRQLLLRALGATGGDARAMIRFRARRVAEHALEARLKAFLLHLGDDQLDDVAWIEAVGTMLVGKAPNTWVDADRARYEVTLADLVRSFRHIESLVFALVQRGDEPGDVWRIGVTDRHSKDREAVVVVQAHDRQRLAGAVVRIEDDLESLGLEGEPELALAALAKAAQRFLADLMESRTLKKAEVSE